MNHFKIGDRYATVFSSALKNCKEFNSINELNLSNNRLSEKGAS